MQRTLKLAFRATIPIMLGYLVMGAAFGLLLQQAGYHFLWSIFMSVFLYCGSMQFVAINLLTAPFHVVNTILMTLAVNFRHVFYGISLIDAFKNTGKKGVYMIFALTDETYSLLTSLRAPKSINQNQYMFFISVLNHLYWITGCTIGAVAGQFIPFDSKGADFAMTALFIVIVTQQWQSAKTHIPALTGVICAILCLVIFGPSNFIFPALILITILLMAYRQKMEQKLTLDSKEETNP